jgi:alpha-mannosidase
MADIDKKSYRAFIVPHTHWDREWYQTFQQFRIRLINLVDNLIDILEKDKAFSDFTLDGQTIVLEDYLEVHPERREVLKKYITEGKIHVGPWYILPDEFLVSAESIVRNLLLGHKIASEFGIVMKIGYIPV